MKKYAGLDVSLKETAICIIDEDGVVLARGVAATEPKETGAFLAEKAPELERAVHESGMLSTWLTRDLDMHGVPIVCIDARVAHRALSARLNKSDTADAEGLAHLARTGFVRLQSYSESVDVFVTEALVRFLFEARRRRLGAASGVAGLSVS